MSLVLRDLEYFHCIFQRNLLSWCIYGPYRFPFWLKYPRLLRHSCLGHFFLYHLAWCRFFLCLWGRMQKLWRWSRSWQVLLTIGMFLLVLIIKIKITGIFVRCLHFWKFYQRCIFVLCFCGVFQAYFYFPTQIEGR